MPLKAEFLDGLVDAAAGKSSAAPQHSHVVALDLGGGGDFFEFFVALDQRREVEAESLGQAPGPFVAVFVPAALGIVTNDEYAGLP